MTSLAGQMDTENSSKNTAACRDCVLVDGLVAPGHVTQELCFAFAERQMNLSQQQ